MRHWVLAAAAFVAAVALGAGTARAGKVEVKGAHLCCPKCVKAATATLSKVDGVADAAAAAGGSITFTTKDDKATAAALAALSDAGFFGTATDDGKDVKVEVSTPKKGEKADDLVIATHVCCPKCQGALKGALPGTTVSFPEAGKVEVKGKDLDKADVIEALRKAGFNGKIE